MELTEHQMLMKEAARSVLLSIKGSPHPTLFTIPFGQMTEKQLREIIAWHSGLPKPPEAKL